MEFLNIIGLLLIAGTNAWIAIQVKRQQTQTHVTVQPAEICYESLATAMENSWPDVSVSNDISLDYDRLAQALAEAFGKVQYEPVPVPVPVQVPVVQPVPPPLPYIWSSESSDNTNVIEINGYKAKQFPAKSE